MSQVLRRIFQYEIPLQYPFLGMLRKSPIVEEEKEEEEVLSFSLFLDSDLVDRPVSK